MISESEKLLLTLINATRETLILIDADGTILFANEVVAQRLGRTTQELIGTSLYSHLPPETASLRKERYDAVGATGRVLSFESTRAGRCYEEHCYPVFDDEGKVSKIAIFASDITEQKETGNALRASEERYRSIFENATEGIFQTTLEGRCLSVNPSFARMFGFDSPEEMVGAVTDIGDQLYVDAAERERLKRILVEQGGVTGFEVELYRKDKSKFWVSINVHAVRDPGGAILYLEGTNEDITERKVTEAKLLESEERYRTAIEHSNDGVALVQGNVHVYMNRRFLEMFGYGPEDTLHNSTYGVVHPDDRERVMEYNRKRQQGEPVPSRYEFKGLRKDGSTIFVEASVAATVYSGKPASLAYLRDVTERKQMEEKLITMSVVDELTGLYNRRGFFALAQRQLKIAERSKREMLLLFADLDKMKWINDTFGHREGDEALTAVATVLKETFRESDIIGRMGGDEFAVLATETADVNPEILATRLRDCLNLYNKEKARGYELSLSMGTAPYTPGTSMSLDELVARADIMMYEDKRAKQGRR